MTNKLNLIIAILLILALQARGQVNRDPDLPPTATEARHSSQDPEIFLRDKIKYPLEALKSGVEGDVILTFIINRMGKVENLTVSGQMNTLLTNSSLQAFDALDDEWIPATQNDSHIDKQYQIIIRYRMYYESLPPDYKAKAVKFEEKQKYDKALKLYDKAILENNYDYELFEGRSRVREKLGDKVGAEIDLEASIELSNEIMAFVDVIAVQKTAIKTIETKKEVIIRN